jgi:ribosome biogenesis GTPase
MKSTRPITPPPFRPRFLDRLILQADAASIRAIIVCNKTDLAASMDSAARAQVERRLALFERMGYDLLFVSVKTGEGLDGLKSLLEGKRAVLAGQSGCGKTSLLNALFPDAMRKTGLLNRKYGSGNHTTVMFEGGGLALIDTPGLRSFTPEGIRSSDVPLLMRDIAPFALKCVFGLSCGHGSEKDCAVREALADGRIDADRFESCTRIARELSTLHAVRSHR